MTGRTSAIPLGRALSVDLRRALFSGRFWLAVALFLAWMLFNEGKDLFLNIDSARYFGAPSSFDNAICGTLALGPIVLAIAAVPYAGSYLEDREAGFDRQAVRRVGFRTFCVSRVLSVALASFLAMAAAMALFLLLLSALGLPHTIPGPMGGYLGLVDEVGPWAYYLTEFLVKGLMCALAAVFSLMVTAWVPNFYVGLMCPLLVYYLYAVILNTVLSVVGATGNGGTMFALVNLDYVIFSQVADDNLFSLAWAVCYLVTFIVLCGRGFAAGVGRERGQ